MNAPAGFGGSTARSYARYRRGYPDVVVDAVAERLGLGPRDTVIDLGCGTGLLTAPLARRVRLVVGVDPEPDMLAEGRRGLDVTLSPKVVWVLGSDADLVALASLLGRGSLGGIAVGQALHFMDHGALFRQARELLRPGGGLAVLSNGVPLWQQDSDWSRAVRDVLDRWFHTEHRGTCGTAAADHERYGEALRTAGYDVHEIRYEYEATLTVDEILGGLYSAMSCEDLPEEQRPSFAERVREALPPQGSFPERVPVTALVGIVR